MADGQGNINRRHTGTVPKIKYSNKAAAIHSTKDQSKSPRMSNNLSTSWHVYADSQNFIQNKGRNQGNRYLTMETVVDGPEMHNGIVSYSANGITPATSSSASRRNSAGSTLKCDNVTKYPDRRQIEDKLSQIREYLEVTNSLMTSIRNSDEQIFEVDEKTNLVQMQNDLLDSEKKLINILEEIDNNETLASEGTNIQGFQGFIMDNLSENSVDYPKRNEAEINSFENSEISSLRDQQLSLLKLQQKAENRLMDARHIQDKLMHPHCSNQVNVDPQKCNKNLSDFDSAIKDLEERAKRLNRNHPNESNAKYQDKIMSEMETLHNKIITMHNANNEREQLIQVLDNRDVELRTKQAELKEKLFELQNKKEQVDRLVMQLQTMDEDDTSEVRVQVHNIVTIKDQLNKLKGMLEIVKSAETNPSDVEATANEICLTAENLQNEIAKPTHKRNDSYVENRLDNNVSNETYQKQSNKGQRNQGARPKQRTSSINEKLALQAELEAKKKELEEIMGKHKAGTSNLNHDVGGNPVNDMSWKPAIFCQDQSSDRLSSDGEENEYSSDVQETQNVIFPPQLNTYYPSNISKGRTDTHSECDLPTERLQSLQQTPERNLRSLSVANSEFNREQPRLSNNQDKLHKQLELIKTVCDSVLDQMPNNQQASFQQVRNNITPTSVYSEQRVSHSPSPHRTNQNQVNVFNPSADVPWFPGQNNTNPSEINSYQNWLATNNLQTQSFMLNTLNQCCQMLWLQQRELASLRNNVALLQERVDMAPYPPQGNVTSTLAPPQSSYDPNRTSNHLRPNPTQKTNHVSAACSMPNLNHFNPHPSNADLAYANSSNVPNSGLLESCLNNASHLNTTQGGADHANNVLHAVNPNLHQAIPTQLWNGPALNNQVAPGNRANNYWDNFRSYSRQNQLSSKNSDTFQNVASGIDRLHSSTDRANPFSLITTSKSNSEHSSSNSHENTPRKRAFKAVRHNIETVNLSTDHAPPPDVLIVNQNISKTGFEQPDVPGLTQQQQPSNMEDLSFGLHRLLNLSCPENNRLLVDVEESNVSKEPMQERRRNEWHSEQPDQRPKKNKLVDELRENVYKEVASLISANEARPHFLIQLFKDLQKIESDSLRLKTLQSIQNILTQSLQSQQNSSNRQLNEPEVNPMPETSSQQSVIWSKPAKHFSSDILNMRLEGDEPFLQNSYKEIVSLLETSDEEFIGSHLLGNIKQVFLESELFKESVKDTVFLKHFSNVLDDVLEQYREKKVTDVKLHLIQTIGDLLQGELSFIHLIQETIPESCIPHERKDSMHSSTAYSVASTLFDIPSQGPLQNGDNIQNGDLAEADQSRIENEIEEEGAVGGLLDVHEDESLPQGSIPRSSEEILNVPTIDYPQNGEGLDQVPTRLPTKIKSGATTPTKDILNSHHDPDPY